MAHLRAFSQSQGRRPAMADGNINLTPLRLSRLLEELTSRWRLQTFVQQWTP